MICPVYTGMNPNRGTPSDTSANLPRVHGDEPFPDGFVVGIDAFAPVYTGMNLVCKGFEKRIIESAPYIRGRVRCTVIAKKYASILD